MTDKIKINGKSCYNQLCNECFVDRGKVHCLTYMLVDLVVVNEVVWFD